MAHLRARDALKGVPYACTTYVTDVTDVTDVGNARQGVPDYRLVLPRGSHTPKEKGRAIRPALFRGGPAPRSGTRESVS